MIYNIIYNIFMKPVLILITLCWHRRVNTFGNKIKVAPDVYHPVHEYNDKLRNIFLDDFKHSMEFKLFMERTGRTSISYSKFLEGALRCPCIREPQMRVCVDKVETMFSEVSKTLAKIRFNNRILCCCNFCIEQKIMEEVHGTGTFKYYVNN